MRYLGGKSRSARHITEVLQAEGRPRYLEPFMGGAGLTVKMLAGPGRPEHAALSDLQPDLMALWVAVTYRDWKAPPHLSEDEWRLFRAVSRLEGRPPSAMIGYVGFGGSYGGKWFSGYPRAPRPRSPFLESKRNLAKTQAVLQAAQPLLRCCSYDRWTLTLPEETLVYLDPPYLDTTGYNVGDWDRAATVALWRWAAARAAEGAAVFVSEYSGPPAEAVVVVDCVWEKEVQSSVGDKSNRRTERLFRVKGYL